jgi:hypothetical protein
VVPGEAGDRPALHGGSHQRHVRPVATEDTIDLSLDVAFSLLLDEDPAVLDDEPVDSPRP